MRRPGSAIVALVLFAGLAHADALDDCAQARNPQVRLSACSDVIAAPRYQSEQKARAHRQRGILRLDAGAVADAIADFGAALRLGPPDANTFAGRARAHMVRGDIVSAVADYAEAIRLAPDHAQHYLGRGHAYAVKGDAQAAISDFTRALQLNPNSANAHNQRGLAYRRSGDNARAIEDYTAAIAINPVYALAYNNRGYAYEAMGRKEEAIADFRAALLLDASLVGARDGLARLGAPSRSATETEQRIREGRALVTSYCIGCHAVGPQGDSPNPKAPAFRTLSARHPGLSLREPLSRGIAAPHDLMPKFTLTQDQVDTIIAYINNLSQGKSTQGDGTGWKTQVQPQPQITRRAADDGLDVGDAGKGLAYARRACAECHNVFDTETASPNPRSPGFRKIANTPGMSVTALTVWSRSSHATMPNLVIAQPDLDNLVAYILSLKSPRP